MSPARIVGRVEELAELDDILDALGQGVAVLVLAGEPGIGKTTLWLEGIRRAEERGAVVLVARPAETEVGLAFSALADLLAPVGDETSVELPEPQRQALGAALLQAPLPEAGLDERAVGAAVLSVLRVLSAKQPVLLAVDDAHWLDPSSARVLAFATRRLAAERVGILVTLRPGEAPPAFVDLAGATPARRTTVAVGPLSVAALHESIKRRTGLSLPRPALVRISQVSGGNPFYALEIAGELARRPSPDGRLPIPENLGGLVETRLRRLPAGTRQALLDAAALSQPTVDAVDPGALAPAEREGIVKIERGRVRFAHPLFASAVYAQADAPARRNLHRRLADVVSDPEERARHLALGAEGPDPEIALLLDAAAAAAGARGASDAAAELADLALELTPTDVAAPCERLLAAGGFHFRAGDLERAASLFERAAAEATGDTQRAGALQLLGQLGARRNGFAEARELAARALAAAGDDAPLRVGIELDLAFYCTSLGDFHGAEPHARAAVDLADELGGRSLSAEPLAVLTMVEFLCGHGFDEAQLAHALALESPLHPAPLVMQPRFVHGLLLLWTGRLEEALHILDALRLESVELGRETDVPLLFLYLVWACVWLGDLRRAAGLAERSRETAALLDDGVANGLALSAAALVHAYEGQVDLARAEGEQAIALFEQLAWRAGTIWPLWALGLLELSLGDPAAVDRLLGPVAAFVTGAGLEEPVLGIFLPDEIEALVELGRLEEAATLADLLARQGGRLDRPWALAAAGRCRGLVLAARGELGAAIATLEQALAEHVRLEQPLERARTLLALGCVLRRNRQRSGARERLVEARAIFERAGARRWAERTEAEIERLGRRTPTGLTPTERRVAELAAAGLSNREIAVHAFLSVKSVEANLTRVYRKLEIRSRGGVARALEAEERPDP